MIKRIVAILYRSIYVLFFLERISTWTSSSLKIFNGGLDAWPINAEFLWMRFLFQSRKISLIMYFTARFKTPDDILIERRGIMYALEHICFWEGWKSDQMVRYARKKPTNLEEKNNKSYYTSRQNQQTPFVVTKVT